MAQMFPSFVFVNSTDNV